LSAALIEQAVRDIQHRQRRLVAARKSHVKQTRKKLREIGIYLKNAIRCKWP
jgi:hypothetical protein